MIVKVRAYSKLNLFLDITGRLPNGRHSLNIATQSVDVYDDITVDAVLSDDFSCRIECDNPDIPCDERNIVYKAAKAFCTASDITARICITIKKNIPVMGGMGGSSVDGAGTLVALNEIFKNRLSKQVLYDIGDSIGADVPICMKGGTQYSTADGSMKSADCLADCVFVCVYPNFTLSTALAYSKYDEFPTEISPYYAEFVNSVKNGSLSDCCKYITNVFTGIYHDDRINNIKNDLLDCGASTAEMTGSGSVVFGVFSAEEDAEKAVAKLNKKYPCCFIARPVNCGVSVLFG
ncbi:MAG: 4-(cytidine 5'-diphospho)-2-C-methyl-D-erythritol kinase [Ruminiclostridium sp.]